MSLPTITPQTEEQQVTFDELDDLLDDGKLSSAIGWAIEQHSVLSDKQEVRLMKKQLQGSSFQGRSRGNWALLTITAKQVYLMHECSAL